MNLDDNERSAENDDSRRGFIHYDRRNIFEIMDDIIVNANYDLTLPDIEDLTHQNDDNIEVS